MTPFDIIALTPFGSPDADCAVAGSRAGAIGVLDLEYTPYGPVVEKNLGTLVQYGGKRVGIKLHSQTDASFSQILGILPPRVGLVILSCFDRENLQEAVDLIRGRKGRILLECTSLEEALTGEQLGVDGIIAKGHEAAGRVGNETTFILFQRLLKAVNLPLWVQGGIGTHTAPACIAAGAAGFVLDSQIALAREAPISEGTKKRLSVMDGTETLCLGDEADRCYRVCSHFGRSAIESIRALVQDLAREDRENRERRLHRAIQEHLPHTADGNSLWLMGQDIAFAGPLALRHVTVGGIVQAFHKAVDEHLSGSSKVCPFAAGSPLARSHGTRLPIVQGPMARVSDTPEFCARVAREGALPFVAASWMRGGELRDILEKTRTLADGLPWGVGMMGFLPSGVTREQLEIIGSVKPPFALIAGAQPGQAGTLEKKGIATYVHIPSPGLLRMFLKEGVRRFVFEGRESGGHVGPLSSFVLWDSLISLLLDAAASGVQARDCHVLFAGGIRNSISSSMIGVMAAPLAEIGACLGLQLGTAYLFTREAVESRAIADAYQREAVRCKTTTLLETGVGHAVRCIDTPFAGLFRRQKGLLLEKGAPPEEISRALEKLKLGRLRIASKGLAVNPEAASNPRAPRLTRMSEQDQHERGLYMVGQLAGLQSRTLTIGELHEDLTGNRGGIFETRHEEGLHNGWGQGSPPPLDIAVIGMACLFPRAPHLSTYWENILKKVDTIGEIPLERWDWRLYYDEDRHAKDKIYSKWGAFLDDIPFDPIRHGMPPNSLHSIEPLHLLFLEVVDQALRDAGYADRPFPRETTSVVLGVSGSGEKGQLYSYRALLPMFFGGAASEITSRFLGHLSEWTEDSFPGILMNVAAGRVANRFNLGGMNCSIDGACASSLAAVYAGVRELEARTSDLVVVGGADCMQNPFTFMCFSKTQALSPRRDSRPLDEKADGIILGEGVAAVILKRLADAERDGDRIYAVIKGMGASSDGRDKSLTAPGVQGQIRALERSYRRAGFSPAEVELIEAHATGTPVGDRTEIDVLTRSFKEAGATAHGCAIGSVKSMIGHTKSAAGLASLIKATLALHHGVLPPTLGVEKPNPALRAPDSPFFVNTEPRPWLRKPGRRRRAAGVSAFGFGGTNFHLALEGYEGDYLERLKLSSFKDWPVELFYWIGESRQELVKAVWNIEEAINRGAGPRLSELALCCAEAGKRMRTADNRGSKMLAVVASSLGDLREKLRTARKAITLGKTDLSDPRGIYFSERPLAAGGKTAFLFPGQGSQYVNMMADLAIQYPEFRGCLERSDRILEAKLSGRLGSFIYPPSAFSDEERLSHDQALANTLVAQPAVGTVDLAMFHLLESLGIRPDMAAGHSYGEYVALCVAGVFEEEDLVRISEARARFIREGSGPNPGVMAAVNADVETVLHGIEGIEEVWVSNLNAPLQTVISGSEQGVLAALARFKTREIRVKRIPTSSAFHSPLVESACSKLDSYLRDIRFSPPRIEVFSNTTAAPHSRNPRETRELLVRHLVARVDFVREIEAMYEEGARIFVEVGPGRVLSGLVDQILKDRPHVAVSSNVPGRSGFEEIQHMLARLVVNGVPVNTDKLYERRSIRHTELSRLLSPNSEDKASPSTWKVNGARARSPRQANHKEEAIRPMEIRPRSETPMPARPLVREASNTTPADDRDVEQVMRRHQRLMQRFLETQKAVMTAYFGGAPKQQGVQPRAAAEESASSQLPKSPEDNLKGVQESMAVRPPGEEPRKTPRPDLRSAAPDPDRIASLLRDIVSERTGYPTDMLDMDMDLEAGLGIDSIKRVEIAGRFLKAVFKGDDGAPPEALEGLNAARTLREIVERTVKVQPREVPPEGVMPPTGITAEPSPRPTGSVGVPRFCSRTVERPLPGEGRSLPGAGVLVVTDDGRGIAEALVRMLEKENVRTAVLQRSKSERRFGTAGFLLEDESPETIRRVLGGVRSRLGPIGGLVHLFPLGDRPFPASRIEEQWPDSESTIRTLYFLLHDLKGDLLKRAGTAQTCVIAATAVGREDCLLPGHGAVSGLLKSLDVEWPDTPVKTVDLSLEERPEDCAAQLFSEISLHDGFAEVLYRGSRRMIPALSETALENRDGNGLEIDASSVILVTGGARGITARVSLELARLYRPTLVLAGRSPLPPDEEPAHTALLTDEAELKNEIIRAFKAEGRSFQLPEVEAAFRRLLIEREIRANCASLREAGSRVEYRRVDVRDHEAFGRLIDSLYDAHGNIDGVIHGAGIIEDRLFFLKTWDSFERVFRTKVRSGLTLWRHLRPETLKFIAFFTSVAGRFGNAGQSDYTAANDEINKLAAFLNRRWPSRVFSVNWGPWAGGGMASLEVQEQFASRGVRLVSPLEGPRMFALELAKGTKEESEIVIGEGPWKELTDLQSPIAVAAEPGGPLLPLLQGELNVSRLDGCTEIIRRFDPQKDLYLQDHRLDDKPVLPATMAIEFIAEAAHLAMPGWKIVSVRGVRVFKGVVLEDGPLQLGLSIKSPAQDGSGENTATLQAGIFNPQNPLQNFYSAAVSMVRGTAPAAQEGAAPVISDLHPFWTSTKGAYDMWLFHGPKFQCIREIRGISNHGMAATLIPSSPTDCLEAAPGASWVMDPVVLDGGLQLVLLWARNCLDITVLPSNFQAVRISRPFCETGIVNCRLHILEGTRGQTVYCDIYFMDEEERLIGRIEGFEATGSRELNRLTGNVSTGYAQNQ